MTQITNEEMENEMRFKASRPTTEIMTEVKKGDWIYWKYKTSSTPSFSYSYVEDVIETKKDGKMLHLTDGYYTNYPLRVLARDINIVEKQNQKP